MANKRGLTAGEMKVLSDVFLRMLPYDKIAVTDKLGAGKAPFTIPNPVGEYDYHMNVGAHAYSQDLSESKGGSRFLVHEATHVWQGEHRWWNWSYVIGSGTCQLESMIREGDRMGAYDYTAGEDWEDYNAEQQAEIVADWYDDGMKVKSKLWHYIRDSLRKPGFGGTAYFFGPAKYMKWTIGEGAVDGYPKSITDVWKSDFIQKADAAVNRLVGTREYYYFFKGEKYIRWRRGSGIDDGYPKKIGEKLDPFMANGIDAAVSWDNGKAYFFKGDRYIRWTWGEGRDDGYPKEIGDVWGDFMARGVDAAINWGNGKAYFFRGDEYIRWTIGKGCDSGYPKKTADTFHSFMRQDMRAALMKRKKLY